MATGDAEIADGFHLTRIRIEVDRVVLLVRGPGEPMVVTLFAPDGGPEGAHLAVAASIVLPEEAPAGLLEMLKDRLDHCDRPIPFVAEIRIIDPARAKAQASAQEARVTARLGGSDATSSWRPGPELSGSLQDLRDGDEDQVLESVAATLSSPNPAPGALSLWLAAGGDAAPCEDQERCPVGEVFADLQDGHLHGAWAARWADEPRLLVRAAERAAGLGDMNQARTWLLAALAAEIPDQAAVDLATSWGWGPGGTVDGLPGRSRSTVASAEPQGAPPSPVLPLIGALIFAAALWRVRRERPWALAGALGLGAALVGGLLAHQGPESHATPSYVEPDPAMLEWGRGAGCELGWPSVIDGALYVSVTCGDERVGVMAQEAEGGGLVVSIIPWSAGRAGGEGEAVEGWLRSVAESDLPGPRFRLEGDGAAEPGLGDRRSRLARLETHQRAAIQSTGPVAFLALAALLALLAMALSTLGERWRTDRRARRALLAALALALVAHAMAPSVMVMVYGGYGQVGELVGWQPLRYGAGANWLYGPWLELFGADHGIVQGINRVYGLLTLIFVAAWAERCAPRTGGLVALALALSPILWRDHGSESILVGGMMMMSAGLFGLALVRRGALASSVLAIPCLALAAMTRPEFALFSLPLAGLSWWMVRERANLDRAGWTTLALAVGAALFLAPSALGYLAGSTRWMVETGALPGLESLGSRLVGDGLNPGRAFWDLAHWMPMATIPLALAAAAWRGTRVLGIGLLLTGLAWMAFTRVDLPAVSIPRVHAPVAVLLTVLAGVGAGRLLDAVERSSWAGKGRAVLGLVLALWWCADIPMITSWLYAPTNADAEEVLLRATEEAIDGEGICLATLDTRDAPPRGKTPRAWPSYLFTGRDRPLRLLGLGEVKGARGICPGGIYALLGMRCYMALRDEESEQPPPRGSPRVQGCSEFMSRWELEEVVGFDARNHGDVAYPMYPDGETLPIGLYKVLKEGAPGQTGRPDRRSSPR
jgi:hypothetical protein